MINEQVLVDSLIALTETCKAAYLMIGTLGTEVAALRETVRSLDPAFNEVLARQRALHPDEAGPRVASMLEAAERLKIDLIS